MSLVTLAKYKEYLKIGSADTSFDTQLTDIQSAVEKRVKEFLLRDLETATYTNEIYDGNCSNELILRQFPITSVTKIEYYEGLDSDSEEVWTTLAQGTDYERKIIPSDATRVILDTYSFVRGVQNYRVTYTAGYSTIPSDIQQACKELLKITWDNSPLSHNRLGFLSTSNNGGSATENLTLDGEIEMKILKKIERYKAINV